jgi:diguanylate cyclase
MAYLDPKGHFRLPAPVRRLLAPRETSEVPQQSWQEAVYRDVGRFLFDHRLDPTPDNYDLAYQFRAASNAQLVSAIRAEIDAAGSLTADAAERIFAQSAGPVSADALADFARRIEAQATGIGSIARQSGQEATAFADALERECADGAAPASIMGLTQAMVGRTRLAEAQLRHAHKELKGLRTTLIEAQRAADVDPLTELPNRRAFKRDLEAMIESARLDGTALSLAFCDIDHFKAVNDAHGHETGDRVLRYVAATLARAFEDSGVVGRFGGEEFVVGLPGLALGAARKAIDAVRERLSERRLHSATDDSDLGSVTFSAGVTTMAEGDAPTDLLRRADEALYCAKAAGRNCVVVG